MINMLTTEPLKTVLIPPLISLNECIWPDCLRFSLQKTEDIV